ncbi:hypothetical protein BCR42DRAFT_404640 [Absidia repens]|uniref:Uncharacterized protein n=1 Tax=Absidia repens TaxID=90262 RepID=A0A1X2IWE2_9FUNG|nr:hypothetical protein BCR42DRAFT_404640 [Absidia repens]
MTMTIAMRTKKKKKRHPSPNLTVSLPPLLKQLWMLVSRNLLPPRLPLLPLHQTSLAFIICLYLHILLVQEHPLPLFVYSPPLLLTLYNTTLAFIFPSLFLSNKKKIRRLIYTCCCCCFCMCVCRVYLCNINKKTE